MLHRVVKLQKVDKYKLHLEFEDGVAGVVDVSKIVPFKGMFAPLKDEVYFNSVTLDDELGTICWENGADISPCHLYDLLSNTD